MPKPGGNINIVDRKDDLKTKLRDISRYWSDVTGNYAEYSNPDVIRAIITDYHRKLHSKRPSRINMLNLLDVTSGQRLA